MDDRRRTDDELVDEALEETFPASDPPARTVETGAHPLPDAPVVENNAAASRLEIRAGDDVAFLEYRRSDKSFTIVHTEVPPALRGRHLGEALVRAALALSHELRLQTIVVCPFARAYLRRHPEALA
jgi:hypothetical protein